MSETLTLAIKNEARRLGFALVGVAVPARPTHLDVFERWLAEGRHGTMGYLADEASRARRTDPRLMIDFATLTGVCEYALTERMSGLFTNAPQYLPEFTAAGLASGERVWNFPMDADYDTDLESAVADVAQCASDARGDHIHGARFLSRFVPQGTPWAHLDLSAAVRKGGLAHVPTDITGFGVRYALELLLGTPLLGKVRPQ